MTRSLLLFPGIFEGLYGGFFGIVAGPTGICLSKLNNLSRTQCLWKAYITFIFLTMMGSIVGSSLIISMIHNLIIYDLDLVNHVALSFVQLTLSIGEDSFFNFLIKSNLSSFDRFVLGFLELRLFKMPAQSITRANTPRKCYPCSKEQ